MKDLNFPAILSCWTVSWRKKPEAPKNCKQNGARVRHLVHIQWEEYHGMSVSRGAGFSASSEVRKPTFWISRAFWINQNYLVFGAKKQ